MDVWEGVSHYYCALFLKVKVQTRKSSRVNPTDVHKIRMWHGFLVICLLMRSSSFLSRISYLLNPQMLAFHGAVSSISTSSCVPSSLPLKCRDIWRMRLSTFRLNNCKMLKNCLQGECTPVVLPLSVFESSQMTLYLVVKAQKIESLTFPYRSYLFLRSYRSLGFITIATKM